MYGILVVDDEIIERNYIKSIIGKYPSHYFMVGEASDGEQALKIAFDKKPTIIIMDISIPLIDGLQTSKIIKSKFKNTIIILNSAYSKFEFAQKAISYDLDAYLLKPASEKIIIETIESTLHENKYCTSTELNYGYEEISDIWDYPYSMLDEIVNSILLKDIRLLENNIENYLNYLRSMVVDVDECKFFIMNSIITLIRTLKKVLEDDDIFVLKGKTHLNKISQAQYWHEIFFQINDFLKLILILLNKNCPYQANISNLLENYIDNNFQNDICSEKLSNIFHYSYPYLSNKFHEDKGYTINKYIADKRLKRAIYLLENSTIAIKDISIMSGFSSISHFNRMFKFSTNKTPSEYRGKGD